VIAASTTYYCTSFASRVMHRVCMVTWRRLTLSGLLSTLLSRLLGGLGLCLLNRLLQCQDTFFRRFNSKVSEKAACSTWISTCNGRVPCRPHSKPTSTRLQLADHCRHLQVGACRLEEVADVRLRKYRCQATVVGPHSRGSLSHRPTLQTIGRGALCHAAIPGKLPSATAKQLPACDEQRH